MLICLVAFFASLLTLFSGFGLGTLLMPVVAIFFPLDVAIAITAIVHMSNNLFKILLVGRSAHISTLIKFGIPAIVFAFLGAWLLNYFVHLPSLFDYQLAGHYFTVEPVKLAVGLLILLLVGIELLPYFSQLVIDKKYLPLGGSLSGFLGGLSGHQGAFRSMFLLKSGLTKEQFIATGVMISVMVDAARLSLYGLNLSSVDTIDWPLVVAASLSAFVGAYFGKKLIKKVTITSIQRIVSVMLVVIAIGLISGFI